MLVFCFIYSCFRNWYINFAFLHSPDPLMQQFSPEKEKEEVRHTVSRIFCRSTELAKYLSFEVRFGSEFGPDVMNLIKKFLSQQVFLFHPAKALSLKAAMRLSFLQEEKLVIVDVGSDWVLRIRDETGYCALKVNLAAVLNPARTHPNYMWTLTESDIQVPKDTMSSSCVVHSGYIRPFSGEMWLHIRDPERGACFEFRVCLNLKRISWPPRACLDC
jgi:hypothetical protein